MQYWLWCSTLVLELLTSQLVTIIIILIIIVINVETLTGIPILTDNFPVLMGWAGCSY